MNKIKKTAIAGLLGLSALSLIGSLQAEALYPLPIPETGPISAVAVTPANSSMRVGETKQYQSAGTFLDLSTRDLGASTFSIASAPINSTNKFSSTTLLTDGKVLVAGVFQDSTTVIPPSFVYDPSNNTFTQTGGMGEARSYYVATLLRNGKVLVVGSFGGPGPTYFSGTAELYDPNMGTFSYTGSTQVARSSPTATLLNNGKVLVTGGWAPVVGVTPATELYDSATGAFSLTGSMSIPRAWHTATRLINGDVLVVGGNIYNGQTNTAEIYDHITGQFRRTGNDMAANRQFHTATLLPSGKVFITGGGPADDEIYDPATDSFSKTGTVSPINKGEGTTATLLGNGKVFMTGMSLSEAMLYDPVTNTLSSTGIVNNNSGAGTVGAPLLKNGKIFELMVGGSPSLAAYVVTPAEGIKWSSSNPAVATISQAGLASAVTFSTTTPTNIVASSGAISGSTPLTVYSQQATVVTNSITNVKQTTATLNGTVNTFGDSGGAYGVCTSSTGTLNYMGVVLFPNGVNGSISVNLTGLTSKVAYTCHMNAWGNHTNLGDAVGSPDIPFTTSAYLTPIATTQAATLVKANSATLNGSCNLQGGAGTAWFTYWRTAKPSVITTTPTQSLLASPSPVPVSQVITLLTKGTPYAYKLTCTNNGGSNTGSPVSFTTLSR